VDFITVVVTIGALLFLIVWGDINWARAVAILVLVWVSAIAIHVAQRRWPHSAQRPD
jgi:hypothetical protein